MPLTRRHLATVVVAAAAAGAGWLFWQGGPPPTQPAPVALQALDGRAVGTAQWKGQVTLVNFWATSCSTCVAEMPELARTYRTHQPKGLQMVAVAMDYDPIDYVRAFAKDRALPFDVAHDAQGAAAHAFGKVRMTPTTFVLNRRGEIVKRYVGKPDFEAMNALIGRLLAEPA